MPHHCTLLLTPGIFAPKELLQLSSDARCRREKALCLRTAAQSQGDRQAEIFQKALQASSEEDRLLFEEFKAKEPGKFGFLKNAKPISVRELCAVTAQGCPLS